jgi:hypothetical protein
MLSGSFRADDSAKQDHSFKYDNIQMVVVKTPRPIFREYGATLRGGFGSKRSLQRDGKALALAENL